MNIDPKQIKYIREKFVELRTKQDIVDLLNDVRNSLRADNSKSLQLKHFTYYANPEICKCRYRNFTLKKKNGNTRIINAPVKGLKFLLQDLNYILQCVYEPHIAAYGFIVNKSIVENAIKHVGQNYVFNLDLKDFFHSFDRNRVKLGFMYEPFNLNGEKEPLAFLLASLCTHPLDINKEIRTVLPQGSPTSPTISNILCLKLDRRLNGLAKRFNSNYTRYADDITFSSNHDIFNDEVFRNELNRIIEVDQRLTINPAKTRLQKHGYRQEVTGLIVNEKVNVKRKYVKQIRMWLFYWEKYGYLKANQIFKKDYCVHKGHIKSKNILFENVLDGKLEYLRMVKGESDGTYTMLKNRFQILVAKNNK